MKKLTIENSASYLPYNVQCLLTKSDFPKALYLRLHDENVIEPLIGIKRNDFLVGGDRIDVDTWEFKLILRPLSDLTKEIEHNGEFICIYEELELNKRLSVNDFKDIKYWIDYLPYGIVKELHKYHFDTDRLIEAGLAIDINELKK